MADEKNNSGVALVAVWSRECSAFISPRPLGPGFFSIDGQTKPDGLRRAATKEKDHRLPTVATGGKGRSDFW
jgi:hypothetical protein